MVMSIYIKIYMCIYTYMHMHIRMYTYIPACIKNKHIHIDVCTGTH